MSRLQTWILSHRRSVLLATTTSESRGIRGHLACPAHRLSQIDQSSGRIRCPIFRFLILTKSKAIMNIQKWPNMNQTKTRWDHRHKISLLLVPENTATRKSPRWTAAMVKIWILLNLPVNSREIEIIWIEPIVSKTGSIFGLRMKCNSKIDYGAKSPRTPHRISDPELALRF